MLKYVFFVVFILASESLVLAANRDTSELVFLTWSDYIDPELVAEFEQQFNARIRFVYYETDPVRDEMMIESDGRGYDVILVSGTQLNAYRQNGWLAPLGPPLIPNLKHIESRWLSAFPAAEEVGVPYAWGTLGIAYRSDMVPTAITHWRQLLEPAETLHGKIVMIKDYQDLMAVALKALGYSANSIDQQELSAAGELLLGQKPYVRSYSYVSLSEESGLVSGELIAAMMYNGDALMVQEHQSAIEFAIPEEGSTLWVDYLAVAAASKHKDLAMRFINFMNIPKNAARLAEFTYLATPNKSAEQLMSDEFLQNPLIYPSPEVLAKSEFYAELPGRALNTRNRIVTELLR